MRIVSNASEGAIDPQINCIFQFWQAFFNVYDGLVTFGKTNGEAGNTVVPDRAKALPKGSIGNKCAGTPIKLPV